MLLLPNTTLGNQRQQAPGSLSIVWSSQRDFLITSFFFSVFILEGFSYIALRMIMWLLQHVLGIHSNLIGNKSNLSAGYFFSVN